MGLRGGVPKRIDPATKQSLLDDVKKALAILRSQNGKQDEIDTAVLALSLVIDAARARSGADAVDLLREQVEAVRPQVPEVASAVFPMLDAAAAPSTSFDARQAMLATIEDAVSKALLQGSASKLPSVRRQVVPTRTPGSRWLQGFRERSLT